MTTSFGCDAFGRPLRTRAVPSKASLGLVPDLVLVTHERVGGSRGLWLRMRRLLDAHLWPSWYALPVQVRRPHQTGRAPVEDYYAVVGRLREVAEHAHQQGVQVSVAEAYLWCCVHPDRSAPSLVTTIADYARAGNPRKGWLAAAAGLGPAEARHGAREGGLSTTGLLTMAALRGHVLPHPDTVPALTPAPTEDQRVRAGRVARGDRAA